MQRCASPDITEGPKLPPAEQRRPGRPKKSVPVSVDTAVSTKWILKTEQSYLLVLDETGYLLIIYLRCFV